MGDDCCLHAVQSFVLRTNIVGITNENKYDGGVEENALVDTLVQSAFGTIAVVSRIATENDLSLTQMRVLAILRDRRLRMNELADYLGLERSTLTGLVDRAQKRGLLSREPSTEDRRATEVFLTQAGREFADRVYERVTAALSPQLDALGAGEGQQLQRLLRGISFTHGGQE